MDEVGEIRRRKLGELKERYGTWTALGIALGRNERDATLTQVWNRSPDSKTGKPREMGSRLARSIEEKLGLGRGWFDQTGESSEIRDLRPAGSSKTVPSSHSDSMTVRVPMLAVAASMGAGAARPDEDIIVGALPVSVSWAARELRGVRLERLRFINAYGNSMSPTFESGDVLLVDTGIEAVDIDGIYVLSSNNELFIKRVTRTLDGRHEVTSDNQSVRQVGYLNGEHPVDVLGRVVWVWNGRKV